jgi:hypothetical protein
MSISKVFVCDIGGETCDRSELMRLGVRTMDDRPEDADNVDVCGQHARLTPIAQALAVAAKMRAEVTGGS